VGGVQEEDAMVSGGRQDGGNAAHLNRRSATGVMQYPFTLVLSIAARSGVPGALRLIYKKNLLVY
jgi:hypothetical protein